MFSAVKNNNSRESSQKPLKGAVKSELIVSKAAILAGKVHRANVPWN